MEFKKYAVIALSGLAIGLLSACQPVMPEAQLTAVAQDAASVATVAATEAPAVEATPVPTEEPAAEDPAATPPATEEAEGEPTAVPTEEAAPAEIGALSPFTSVAGIRLLAPPEWASREDEGGILMLASSPEVLEDDSLAVPGAIFVVINAPWGEMGNLPPGDLLQAWIAGLPIVTELVSGPEAAVVNGHEGVRAVATGESEGRPFLLIGAAFNDDDRIALAASIFPQDQEGEFRTTVEAMLDSIEVVAPDAAQLDLSAVEDEITPGEPANGAVSPSQPAVLRFSGEGGQAYLVSVAPTTTLDVVIDVVDASGASILEYGRGDSEGAGLAERRLAILPADGDYYVVVRGYGADSQGDFEAGVTPTQVVGDATAEELVGTWGQQGLNIRFDPEGGYAVALAAADLDSTPVLRGPYRLEDGLLVLGGDEGAAVCVEGEGSYEALLLEGGELFFRRADDPCLLRSRGLSGLVMLPGQP